MRINELNVPTAKSIVRSLLFVMTTILPVVHADGTENCRALTKSTIEALATKFGVIDETLDPKCINTVFQRKRDVTYEKSKQLDVNFRSRLSIENSENSTTPNIDGSLSEYTTIYTNDKNQSDGITTLNDQFKTLSGKQ